MSAVKIDCSEHDGPTRLSSFFQALLIEDNKPQRDMQRG